MKNSILLLAVLLTLCLYSNAQDKSQKFLIGGHFSLSNSNQESDNSDSKTFSLSISPAVGYFVSERWLIGLKVNYSYQKSESSHSDIDYESDFTMNNYLFGPYARYYIPLGEKFKLYTQLETLYGINKRNDNDKNGTGEPFNTDSDRKLFSLAFNPGLSFNITKKLLLEAEFGEVDYLYLDYKTDDDNDYTQSSKHNSFGISLNTISFGLALLL